MVKTRVVAVSGDDGIHINRAVESGARIDAAARGVNRVAASVSDLSVVVEFDGFLKADPFKRHA